MNKFFVSILCLFVSLNTFAEIGKVTKVAGANDGYILRANSKLPVTPEMDLELNDEVFSENSYIVVYVYPGTQMSLSKHTQTKLSQHAISDSDEKEKASSVIDLVKGVVRLQVTRDTDQEIEQKVQARGVAFGVRGTEFEISDEGSDEVDLDVIEGEVTVSSPDVHTFVPEVVKANEGFRFDRKRKSFGRRKFALKFKDHPGFKDRAQLKKQWKELRKNRKARLQSRKDDLRTKKQELKERRKSQRENRKRK